MTTEYTNAEMAEAEAAFERAFAAHDPEGMKEILLSESFALVLADRDKKTMQQLKPMLLDTGGELSTANLARLVIHEKVLRQALVQVQRARFGALEARIAELEKTPFAYDGPHESGKTYGKGTFVTHAGSLWHANYTTASRPGDGPAWTLAVKHGKDAR